MENVLLSATMEKLIGAQRDDGRRVLLPQGFVSVRIGMVKSQVAGGLMVPRSVPLVWAPQHPGQQCVPREREIVSLLVDEDEGEV
jgi:hypothetical protein